MCEFDNNLAETAYVSALHLYSLFSLTVGSIWTMYQVLKVVQQMLVCVLTVNKDMLQKEVSLIRMSKEHILETWINLLSREWSSSNRKQALPDKERENVIRQKERKFMNVKYATNVFQLVVT